MRRPGGGRKSLVEKNAGVLPALLAIVEPDARGDPMSPLRWTCKSLRTISGELVAQGFKISHTVVGELLAAQTFSPHLRAHCRRQGELLVWRPQQKRGIMAQTPREF